MPIPTRTRAHPYVRTLSGTPSHARERPRARTQLRRIFSSCYTPEFLEIFSLSVGTGTRGGVGVRWVLVLGTEPAY
jgi:hypothetical protein